MRAEGKDRRSAEEVVTYKKRVGLGRRDLGGD